MILWSIKMKKTVKSSLYLDHYLEEFYGPKKIGNFLFGEEMIVFDFITFIPLILSNSINTRWFQ